MRLYCCRDFLHAFRILTIGLDEEQFIFCCQLDETFHAGLYTARVSKHRSWQKAFTSLQTCGQTAIPKPHYLLPQLSPDWFHPWCRLTQVVLGKKGR